MGVRRKGVNNEGPLRNAQRWALSIAQ